MGRSAVGALRRADIDDAADGRRGCSSPSCRGKTNQKGDTMDCPVREGRRRPGDPDPSGPPTEDRVVPLSPKMAGLRFQAAARAAGVDHVTAHSGRVGLASEQTS